MHNNMYLQNVLCNINYKILQTVLYIFIIIFQMVY